MANFNKILKAHRPIEVMSRCTSFRDVTFPNFDAYRHEDRKNPSQPSRVTEDEHKGIS